jgi:hypothetical protein
MNFVSWTEYGGKFLDFFNDSELEGNLCGLRRKLWRYVCFFSRRCFKMQSRRMSCFCLPLENVHLAPARIPKECIVLHLVTFRQQRDSFRLILPVWTSKEIVLGNLKCIATSRHKMQDIFHSLNVTNTFSGNGKFGKIRNDFLGLVGEIHVRLCAGYLC